MEVNYSGRIHNDSLLLEFNHQMLLKHIPVIVYLSLVFLVGSVGNVLVIYIYGCRFKVTTPNLVYMWLGVFDLCNCVLGITSEIVDLSLHVLYQIILLCKITKFVVAFFPAASMSLLVIIAVDRPLRSQMEVHHAKIGVAISVAAAVVMSISALFLFGKRTVDTPFTGLKGTGCSIQDKYQGSLLFKSYAFLMGLILFSYIGVLAFLYTRMWREIRRCQKYSANLLPTHFALSPTNGPEDCEEPERGNESQGISQFSGPPQEMLRTIQEPIHARKSLWIAFVVTVVFVVSYFPYLILTVWRTVDISVDQQQAGAKFALYSIFMRSHFLNSVCNVFVYGGMSSEFRSQCKRIASKRSVSSSPVDNLTC